MPPSMLSSEALVIWMLRIAMKAPIMAASTAIHTAALARPGLTAMGAGADDVRSDMASPLGNRVGDLRLYRRSGRIALMRQRLDARDHRHARAQLDRRRIE